MRFSPALSQKPAPVFMHIQNDAISCSARSKVLNRIIHLAQQKVFNCGGILWRAAKSSMAEIAGGPPLAILKRFAVS